RDPPRGACRISRDALDRHAPASVRAARAHVCAARGDRALSRGRRRLDRDARRDSTLVDRPPRGMDVNERFVLREVAVLDERGGTLLRDPGGADAGIRDALAAGFVPGPRLQVAVVTVCQTGGHADGYLPGAEIECSADYVASFPGRPPYLVDGADEMRKVVRRILRAGADWIKLCTTGGILSPHDDGEIPELTEEEIAVAVFE